MSSIAVTCGLIILVLLVIMLLAGVPIAVALAVSSIAAILPVLNTGAAVLTGAQRIFSGISVFSLLAIPFFILVGNLMNKGGIAIRLINFAIFNIADVFITIGGIWFLVTYLFIDKGHTDKAKVPEHADDSTVCE